MSEQHSQIHPSSEFASQFPASSATYFLSLGSLRSAILESNAEPKGRSSSSSNNQRRLDQIKDEKEVDSGDDFPDCGRCADEIPGFAL